MATGRHNFIDNQAIQTILEAIDAPQPNPLPFVKYDTPAVVQQSHKISNRLIDFIKRVENQSKTGWHSGKWYPHHSVEGGNPTIAYGHKVKQGQDFSAGITDQQALELLHKDLEIARRNARFYVDQRFGRGVFDTLGEMRQEMLIEYAFNLGSLNKFPSFVTAVVHNNVAAMRKEYVRYAETGGQKKPLHRNNDFYDTYLKNYSGGHYIANIDFKSVIH